MSFLLSFLTVEFRIPLEVKELGENIILKVLLHMYTKCIYMVEKRTQVVRLVLYMYRQGLLLILIQRADLI